MLLMSAWHCADAHDDFRDFISLSAAAFMQLLCASAPGPSDFQDILFSLVQNEKMSRPTVAYAAWLFFPDEVPNPKPLS